MATINYEVFNALNLINPKLGQAHQNTGFNPFKADFKITVAGIKKLLDLKKSPCKEVIPRLVELPEKKANSLLKLGKSRIDNLLTKLQFLTKIKTTETIYDEICYLKICQELLSNLTLSSKNFDEVKDVLRIIKCLEPQYAACLEGVFTEKFDEKRALSKYVSLSDKPKVISTQKVNAAKHPPKQHVVQKQEKTISKQEFEREI